MTLSKSGGVCFGGVLWPEVGIDGLASCALNASGRVFNCALDNGGPGSPTMYPGTMGFVPYTDSAEVVSSSGWKAVFLLSRTHVRQAMQFSPDSSTIWYMLPFSPIKSRVMTEQISNAKVPCYME